jgi:hypothetical protein
MIKIQVDPRSALGWITQAMEKQIPFAVSKALNQVANLAQAAEREQVKKAFKLRREQFVLRGVKIKKADRASKTSWSVVIRIEYPGIGKFMNLHEPGGEREPHHGGKLWVPNREVFKSKVITRDNALHPKNLKIHKDSTGRMVGAERAFMVRTKGGQLLVLQREDRGLTKASKRTMGKLTLDNLGGGQGPSTKAQKYSLKRTGGTRLLYRLVSKVKVPARLEFVSTVRRTVAEQWPAVLVEEMGKAMRSAR